MGEWRDTRSTLTRIPFKHDEGDFFYFSPSDNCSSAAATLPPLLLLLRRRRRLTSEAGGLTDWLAIALDRMWCGCKLKIPELFPVVTQIVPRVSRSIPQATHRTGAELAYPLQGIPATSHGVG